MDNSILLLALILIIIITVYWFSTRSHNYWENQNVPYLPRPKPFFGHTLKILTLQESPVTFASKAYRSTSASMIGFYHMNEPGLIIREPELIKNVMQTNFTSFHTNIFTYYKDTNPIVGRSPFHIGDLAYWKKQRTHLANHFTPRKINYLTIIFQEVCSKLCDFVERKIGEDGETYECELGKLTSRYTSEIAAHAALRIEGESFEDNPDEQSFSHVIEDFMKADFLNEFNEALMTFTPRLARLLRLKYVPDSADAYFRKNVNINLEKMKQGKISTNDYLQITLESNSKDDIDSIVADIGNFCIEVNAPARITLAHLLYHLSVNPEVQTKLREHIISELGDDPVTYESLKKLTYLDQVINEALRLSAPQGISIKRCTKEITLTGSDGLTCQVKPGFPIIIPVLDIQSDEKYWTDPEKFDPVRFSPENRGSIKKCTYMPFGEGPKMCVGMRLGLSVTKMAAVFLIRNYTLERSSKTTMPLEFKPTIIMMSYKGGLWAKFKKL